MKAENGGKQMTNVWTFPLCGGKERLRDAAGNKLHSTQKPEALLRRVILSSTNAGDVVLDPFLGSGTTLAVARRLGRVGVGIERSADYVKAAVQRIEKTEREVLPDLKEEIKPPRVPFKALLEHGLIKSGQWLHSKDGGVRAQVRQDGTIKVNGAINAVGSIHQVGAQVAGAPSCNGWHFWRVKDQTQFLALSRLRERIIQEELQ